MLDKLTMQARNGQNLEHILEDVRETNRHLVGLRDKVERDLTRKLESEQAEHAQTRAALRNLEKEIADVKRQRSTSAASGGMARATDTLAPSQPSIGAVLELRQSQAEAPQAESVRQVVEVVAHCDPALIAEMVRSTVAALRRYQDAAAEVSPPDAQPLLEAITDVITTGDVQFVSLVVQACAVALGRLPSPAAIPAPHERALQEALVAFGDVIKTLYPTGPRAPHGPAR